MIHNINLNSRKKIILCTIFFIMFNQCNTNKKDSIPVQTYYYEFKNFDSTPDSETLYNDVIQVLFSGDYIISNCETLEKIEKSSVKSIDSLSKYHKLIHRLSLIDDADKLKPDDIKITIRYIPKTDSTGSAIEYARYEYSNQHIWQLKYNFGKHVIVNFRNNYKKQVEILALEIARASFK